MGISTEKPVLDSPDSKVGISVRRYSQTDQAIWDDFVKNSKNGLFLFYRSYMDYHSERFPDHSLLFFDAKDRLIAILPANIADGVLYSHAGLTFGGVLCTQAMTASLMLQLFDALIGYCRDLSLKKVIYKCIPYLYCSHPSEEDRYALFRVNATLLRRDITTALMPMKAPSVQERRLRGVDKARKKGLCVREIQDYEPFWRVLKKSFLKRIMLNPFIA